MIVIITSGGTTEQIDVVRGITNFSSGRLGAKIADELVMCDVVSKVYYVCAQKTVRPSSSSRKIEIVSYTDVYSIQNVTYNLLRKQNIDVLIHASAISDYYVTEIRDSNGLLLDRNGKIRSGILGLTVKLEPTHKIISKFKQISPETTLIGFKLMSDVSNEQLFDAADKVLKENNCTFVLANRLEDINGENHIAYLRSNKGTIEQYKTKAEIAKGIVNILGLGR